MATRQSTSRECLETGLAWTYDQPPSPATQREREREKKKMKGQSRSSRTTQRDRQTQRQPKPKPIFTCLSIHQTLSQSSQPSKTQQTKAQRIKPQSSQSLVRQFPSKQLATITIPVLLCCFLLSTTTYPPVDQSVKMVR